MHLSNRLHRRRVIATLRVREQMNTRVNLPSGWIRGDRGRSYVARSCPQQGPGGMSRFPHFGAHQLSSEVHFKTRPQL